MTNKPIITKNQDEETIRFAFDPHEYPELYANVRTRRCIAFLIDAAIILALTFCGYILVSILGILTFGFGFFLFAAVFPVVALLYTAMTLGGSASATIGMRSMGVQMRLWHGGKMYALIAVAHALLFWFLCGILIWPIVIVTSFFSDRKRCLHDILIGTMVLNKPEE